MSPSDRKARSRSRSRSRRARNQTSVWYRSLLAAAASLVEAPPRPAARAEWMNLRRFMVSPVLWFRMRRYRIKISRPSDIVKPPEAMRLFDRTRAERRLRHSLVELMELAARAVPDRAALVYNGESVTFADVLDRMRRVAAYLVE